MNFQFLGSFLLGLGVVTQAQIDEAMAYQADSNRRLGDLAVEAGMLTPEQVEDVLDRQRATDRSFGGLAVSLGYISQRRMDELLFRQKVRQVHLGEALLALGHLTAEQFSRCLEMHAAQEKQRLAVLDGMLSSHCGRRVLGELVSALERAFQRFAHCPLKAQGVLDDLRLNSLTQNASSEVTIAGLGTVRFTLRLGPEMMDIMAAALAEDDLIGKDIGVAVDDLLGIICCYLEKSLAKACSAGSCAMSLPPGTPPVGDCLRLRLACPEADLGLIAAFIPESLPKEVSA